MSLLVFTLCVPFQTKLYILAKRYSAAWGITSHNIHSFFFCDGGIYRLIISFNGSGPIAVLHHLTIGATSFVSFASCEHSKSIFRSLFIFLSFFLSLLFFFFLLYRKEWYYVRIVNRKTLYSIQNWPFDTLNKYKIQDCIVMWWR